VCLRTPRPDAVRRSTSAGAGRDGDVLILAPLRGAQEVPATSAVESLAPQSSSQPRV